MQIVVPIMPESLEDALALDVDKYQDADLIEWRADYLPKEEILQVAPAIFEKFSGREVIFTLRTVKEGGRIELSDEEYVGLIKEINHLYEPDYLDFEYFSYPSVFDQMLDSSNLVLSYHNFKETPDNLMEIMSELTALAPKMVKLAVMPNREQDVLDLMNFTRGFKGLNPEQNFATMSMGKLGRVTRLSALLTGSSWTFACVDEQSAPGQVQLKDMVKIREVLNED
ncbi:type I 3-dehydroquinate dehydratase [Streptococcus ovuberis]|uniref:3-dehydroquinate dehydratase n=1 Tax=Streptococcus ovuberis TaxID=1936207 RepID=A0A7X6N208_9STRE|nr:type I 3-dehydroquinate dehydratase [Streptococcus ovuberis]NKZ20767.1 type I 3-dehydroquinate dehydratase [Streptococcus ovuberis]